MFHHTPEYGFKKEALKSALKKAFDLSKEITIAVHGKRPLSSNIFEEILGEKGIKALRKDNIYKLRDGAIHLITERIKDRLATRPIVCIHVSLDFLQTLAQEYPCREII